MKPNRTRPAPSYTLPNARRALRWAALAASLPLGCQSLLGVEDATLKPAAGGTDCLLNSDKPQVCIFKTCSPPCQEDKDCDPGRLCLLAGENGSACVSQQQAKCDGATSGACPAGSVCSEGQCRTDCSSDANACRQDQECGASGVCLATDTTGSGGSGGSGGISCVPKASVCDGNRATTCNAEGTGFEGGGLKCSSKQTCVAGACEAHECTPSARFCTGKTVRQCADNGLSSTEAEACGNGQYCDAASATCKAGVCAPDEAACDGARATTCNASGSGFLGGGEVCGAKETCEGGACVEHLCPAGEGFCLGQYVKSCAVNGLSSMVEATCVDMTCLEAAGSASCTGVCAPGQTQCSGNGVQSCGANGEYGAVTACAAATPVCRGAGVCGVSSCSGLAATCGAAGNASCCASSVIPGGTYNRSSAAAYPATVAGFRLDTYEITVGRFRKFVAAYTQSMIAAGAGKNPNNGADPGWDTAWNASLPADP